MLHNIKIKTETFFSVCYLSINLIRVTGLKCIPGYDLVGHGGIIQSWNNL